ncbi:MAG: hypothetical protein IPH84_10785 [Bacteroidales bacterium]|nr:hypothetical protein [Bacteroidales bacterium]
MNKSFTSGHSKRSLKLYKSGFYLYKIKELINLGYTFFSCPTNTGFSFLMFSILFRRAMVNGFLKEAIMYSGLICTYILIFLIGTIHHST